MSRRYRIVIPRNTAHFAKRLAQPFSKHNLLCAARALAPALFAFAISGVAHAQGTMDFSGAQTLMGTFNVGSPAVQSQVVFPNSTQIVSKQPVCAFDSQREHVRDLKQHAQRGVVPGTSQVGKEVLGDQLPPFSRIEFTVIRWLNLSMQFAQMSQGINHLTAGYVSIHSEGSFS